MEATTAIKYGSFLKDQVVKVKPVESSGKWGTLLVKGQEMKKDPFIYNKVKRSIQVPLRNIREGGGVVKVLDDYNRIMIKKYELKYPQGMTQQEFFEEELNTDLNPSLPAEKNFWRTDRRGRVTLTKEGITLDLRQSLDMLKYLILLSDQARVAPSYEARELKASYEWVIVDESVVVSKKVEEAEFKAKAFAKYLELTQSVDKLKGFIRSLGRTIPVNHTEDWLKQEVLNVLEASPANFVAVLDHPQYEAKIFIQNAVEAGAILRMGDKRYTLDNGVELGDLTDAINYLSNPENQDVKTRIKARIEMAKKN